MALNYKPLRYSEKKLEETLKATYQIFYLKLKQFKYTYIIYSWNWLQTKMKHSESILAMASQIIHCIINVWP